MISARVRLSTGNLTHPITRSIAKTNTRAKKEQVVFMIASRLLEL
jgi:hypothetical protein